MGALTGPHYKCLANPEFHPLCWGYERYGIEQRPRNVRVSTRRTLQSRSSVCEAGYHAVQFHCVLTRNVVASRRNGKVHYLENLPCLFPLFDMLTLPSR